MNTHVINKVLDILISNGIDEDTVRSVSNSLVLALREYEITRKETSLVRYEPSEDMVLLEDFLITKRVSGMSDRSLEEYRRHIRQFLILLGKPVREITARDITAFTAYKLREGASERTCNNYRHSISSFFEYLISDDIVTRNPVKIAGEIKIPVKVKEAFTDVEIEKMRNCLADPKQKAIFELLLSSACRVSELVSIRTKDIDGNTIKVTGKGNKERRLIINARAEVAIGNYLESDERKNVSSEFLFPGRNGGAQTRAAVEKMIRKIGAINGIHAHPHKFRRTCATRALERGMDIAHISRMLGHANIGTTQVYLSISDEELIREHRKYVV